MENYSKTEKVDIYVNINHVIIVNDLYIELQEI